jgi:chromosome segregation ATPase
MGKETSKKTEARACHLEQLAAARNIAAQRQNPMILEAQLERARTDITQANSEAQQLRDALISEQKTVVHLRMQLTAAQNKAEPLAQDVKTWQAKSKHWYEELRAARCARQRATECAVSLAVDVLELKKSVKALTKANDRLNLQLSKTQSALSEKLAQSEQKEALLKTKLASSNEQHYSELKAINTKLQAVQNENNRTVNLVRNMQERVEVAEERAKDLTAETQELKIAVTKKDEFCLKEKGVYREEVREMVRSLASAGMHYSRIGPAIRELLQASGYTNVVGKLSPRTVDRIIVESYIAGLIQLGYEFKEAKGRLIIFF